jgi:3-phenylpropionate/trans-cinnamate dioxygenase ferredoxin subunit
VAFVKLARVEDIPPGQTKFLHVDGKPVILANFEGRIYATFGLCPHQNNPLEGATMLDNLIDCPFHHFQYDVTTGKNYFPKNVYPKDCNRLEAQVRPLKTYAVELRDGEVWVDLE